MKRVAAFVAALTLALPIAASAQEDGTIQLTFYRPHAPTARSSQARSLLTLVNAVRAQHGLPALVADPALDRFAADKAEHMATRHYFGHTDPNGVTFESRLKDSGLKFRYAAENIAFDQDERHANAAFVGSPGHFANMVDPNHRKIGIAVVEAGAGESFFVEEFSD